MGHPGDAYTQKSRRRNPWDVVCFGFYRARQGVMRKHTTTRSLAHSQVPWPLPVVAMSTWHRPISSAISGARPQRSDRWVSRRGSLWHIQEIGGFKAHLPTENVLKGKFDLVSLKSRLGILYPKLYCTVMSSNHSNIWCLNPLVKLVSNTRFKSKVLNFTINNAQITSWQCLCYYTYWIVPVRIR